MVRRFFIVALGLELLLLIGAQACGSTHEGNAEPDATHTPDATVEAAADAANPADGSSDATALSDAPPEDADAATVDAATGDAASDADATTFGDGGCGTTTTAYAPDASPHVAVCSSVTYASNPPTSGPHYPVWAAYRSYTTPVPRGFYVHDLEHGAVVILYNCPSGCAQDVADLQTFLDARTADPLCTLPVKNRFVVTPDPLIPTRFAAVAWGYALTSDCFDLAALGTFIDDHYAHAPEDLCADGTDVTAADAGFPADCGQ